MSILTGPEIERLVISGGDATRRIVLDPFDAKFAGPNSFDLHLGDELLIYDVDREKWQDDAATGRRSFVTVLDAIDAKSPPKTKTLTIPSEGYVIEPNRVYLAATREYTETFGLVPIVWGRSSVGRLGVSVHCTAGFGDTSFCGHWGLQISCVQPVRIYAGMKIAQVVYFTTEGELREYQGRYQNQAATPIASRFHEHRGAD